MIDKISAYVLDHPDRVLLFIGIFVMPLLSALVRWLSKSKNPSLVAVSKIIDGLGLDPMKIHRAILLLLGKAPTADEIARDINAPPEDPEDTGVILRKDIDR